jgi:hypothetical protein
MNSKAELITPDMAKKAGLAIKTVSGEMEVVRQIEEAEGAIVASFARIAALQRMAGVLNQPEVEAMIVFAGRQAGQFEIAESDDRKIPDHLVLIAAKEVLCKGYLLSDAAGPHFTVIAGKGGKPTHLIKEAGHRYKLKQYGVQNLRVQACAAEIRQRPNNGQKFDMLVTGFAECVVGGKTVRVERTHELPMYLPCYPSDGPDKYEGQGRRRLLRDLWAAVSGAFEPIELDEVDQVEPVKIATSRFPVTEIRMIPEPQPQTDLAESHRLAFESQSKILLEKMAQWKIPAAKVNAVEACIDAIRAADDADILAQRWGEIRDVLKDNEIKPGGIAEVEKLHGMRLRILRGDL